MAVQDDADGAMARFVEGQSNPDMAMNFWRWLRTANLKGDKGDVGSQGVAGTNGTSPPKYLYKGTSSGSGTYSVTYPVAFASVPNVQVQLVGGTPNQIAILTSSTTTGFTVTVYQRNSINLLSTDLLLFATNVLNGASVNVAVFE